MNERIYKLFLEVYGHLQSADVQSHPSDDQIIMGHLRAALAILKTELGIR